MVSSIKIADEGQVITKRKIQVVVRKFITKKRQTKIKKNVIIRLGMNKM